MASQSMLVLTVFPRARGWVNDSAPGAGLGRSANFGAAHRQLRDREKPRMSLRGVRRRAAPLGRLRRDGPRVQRDPPCGLQRHRR